MQSHYNVNRATKWAMHVYGELVKTQVLYSDLLQSKWGDINFNKSYKNFRYDRREMVVREAGEHDVQSEDTSIVPLEEERRPDATA